MIINLFQRYLSIFSGLATIVIVIEYFGITTLGIYSFVNAISILISPILIFGVRLPYVRNFINYSEKNLISEFVIFSEVLPFLILILGVTIYLALGKHVSLDAKFSADIIFISFLYSQILLCSQKLRALKKNMFSQFIRNSRNFSILCSLIVFINLELDMAEYMTKFFIFAYMPPVIIGHIVLYSEFFHLIKKAKLTLNYENMKLVVVKHFVEVIPLITFSFLQKAKVRVPEIICGTYLGFEALGIFRAVFQVINACNASLFVVQSNFILKVTKLILKQSQHQVGRAVNRAAYLSTILYSFSLVVGVLCLYSLPILLEIKHLLIFKFCLLLSVPLGLADALMPMFDQRMIASNKVLMACLFLALPMFILNSIFLLNPDLFGLISVPLIILFTNLIYRFMGRMVLI